MIEKYADGQEQCLNLEVWIENAKGERTTMGTAMVAVQAGKESEVVTG